MFFNAKIFVIIFLFFIQNKMVATVNVIDTLKIKTECNTINHRWIEQNLNLTKNCVGFSTPVAARAFNYISIGMYESIIDFLPNQKSLSGQLTDFNRMTWSNNKELHFPTIVNEINYQLTSFFYKNMPPENLIEVEHLYNDLSVQYSKSVNKKNTNNSKRYAANLSQEIIEWSKKDGGNEGYKRNFPASYIINSCKSCWSKTTPGYQSALLPYWGRNKLLVNSNIHICDDIPAPVFSTDTLSEFFKDAQKLNILNMSFTNEQKIIAKYWDDSPGYSGSPVGHLFSIANDLSIIQNKTLEQTCELFVILGITINDAIIECWNLKYKYNLIRPISYIQRYMNTDFNTLIPTPPFPEFPSGHSFQAGAAEEVFKYFFTDSIPFTDKTNVLRTDIIGKERNFKNFSNMSEEMSLSRFYAGIHFLNTLKISLEYGRKIGINTISSLSFRK